MVSLYSGLGGAEIATTLLGHAVSATLTQSNPDGKRPVQPLIPQFPAGMWPFQWVPKGASLPFRPLLSQLELEWALSFRLMGTLQICISYHCHRQSITLSNKLTMSEIQTLCPLNSFFPYDGVFHTWSAVWFCWLTFSSARRSLATSSTAWRSFWPRERWRSSTTRSLRRRNAVQL